MKATLSLFLASILLLLLSAAAFSADIDGIDNGAEWDNATAYRLVDGESNCGVEFGLVKVKFDMENSAFFMCFMFIDPMLEQGNLSVGVSVSIENSEPFVLTMASSPQNTDIDKYNITGAMSIDENNGATCEIRVGVKAGLPKTVSGNVRFIDASGEPSNYYAFTLVNESYVETTGVIISPTKDNDDPAYNPGLLTRKTTKEQTLKPDTTRKKRTTTKPTERTRWALKDSPYTYTGRTKRETERKEIVQTVIVPAVTVYYYEKEIIISHVFISEPNALVKETREVSTDITSSVSESQNQTVETGYDGYLSDGKKYKIVLMLCAGAAFAAIAMFGVSTAKHKTEKENKE